jgi:ABC-type nitrate/sulfonate/bicarbonate transport system substrate-binding protein
MAAGAICALATGPAANAEIPVTIGVSVGVSGFHIPYYVGVDRGLFKAEGLDAKLVAMSGKALVNAGLGGAIDFVPIPTGGVIASLHGAKIKFIVNGSLISQWTLVAPKSVTKVAQLKGKTCGYSRAGSAGYDEGEITLRRFFDMRIGRDYKVISFQGEADIFAALINGSVSCGLLTFPNAAKALKSGFHILLRTGDYLPRLGPLWVTEKYFEANKDTVRRFIRAVAKAEQYIADNKAGTVPVIQKHFGIKDPAEAEFIWDQLHNEYGPDIVPSLFAELYEGRIKSMKASGLWPKDKPDPDFHAYVARDMLRSTLRGMGYYLQRPPQVQGKLKPK